MKPLKLIINAFGPFADKQEIDFTLLGDKTFFLIHGPTGSGKTTILDAMAFALYGTASGDLRVIKSLRSDYAPPSKKTEIVFSFTAGGKTWEVTRSPEQDLKKQRGEGNRKMPASAVLVEIQNQERNVVASGTNDVTEKIEKIIGFKADQFCQIVLLPQGEFRRFLIANSNERKVLLETLFKTQIYGQIENLLKEHSKEIEKNYIAVKTQKDFLLETLNCTNDADVKTLLVKLQKDEQEKSLAAALQKAQLQTARTALQQAKELTKAFTDAAIAKASWETLQNKAEYIAQKRKNALLAEKAELLQGTYLAAQRSYKHYQEVQAELTAATTALTKSEEANTALEKNIANSLGSQNTSNSDLGKILSDLNTKIVNLSGEAAKITGISAELERLAQDLRDDTPCPVCGSLHHPAPATLSIAHKTKLTAQVATLSKEIKILQTYQQQYQKAQINLAASKAALDATGKNKLKLEEEFNTLRATYKTALEASPFDNQKAFLDTLPFVPQKEQLRQEVSDYEQNLAAVKERYTRAADNIKEKTPPPLETLALETSALEQSYQALTENLAVLKDSISKTILKQQELKKLEQKIENLDTAYITASALAKTAQGENALNLSFSAYVLQAILDDVLSAANLRLHKMSRGRYSLHRTDTILDGRRKNGLNMEIMDSFTGMARPVQTLSGGEMFLASLSLALGLSDVIQSYAGGVRLDTILVDEGFGSLDEEALDMAIRTLTELQKGGRLVGIISHVAELQERIPTRLEVTPGQQGSIAKFHI
ncbi:MAG: SMC family ATPase [Acidaminococcaceae bacterium]